MNGVNGVNVLGREQTAAPRATSKHVHEVGEPALFRVGENLLRVSVEYVTPEMADEWLKHRHVRNRNTPATASKYTADLTAGAWQWSPEPIVWDNSDPPVLVDGENRLKGVRDSGVAAYFTVWRGVPPETFRILNTGKPRTLAQSESMVGDVRLTPLVVTIARSSFVVDRNNNRVNNDEIRKRARAILPAWEAVGPIVSSLKFDGHRGFRASAQWVMCLAWMSEPDLIRRFVDDLRQAIDRTATPNSAIRNLLKYCERIPSSGGSELLRDVAIATANAITQYQRGDDKDCVRSTATGMYESWRSRAAAVQVLGAR